MLTHTLTHCALFTDDPCKSVRCRTGSRCKIYKPTGEAFCEASCDLDNGGCSDNEQCSLQDVQCVRAPCPPVVKCTPSKYLQLCSATSITVITAVFHVYA